MKFLESKEISSEKDNVKVIFKPMSMVNKSALLGYNNSIYKGMAADDGGMIATYKMKSVAYILLNMINSLTVGEEKVDHIKCGSCADVNDPDTLLVLNTIYDLAMDLILEGDTKKKSSSPPSRTKKK
jgi:hypothetical protein